MELLVRRVETVEQEFNDKPTLIFDLLLARNAKSNTKKFDIKSMDSDKILDNIQRTATAAFNALFGALEPDVATFLAKFKDLLDLPGPWKEKAAEAEKLKKAQAAVAQIQGLLTTRGVADPAPLAAALYGLNKNTFSLLDPHGVTNAEYTRLVTYSNSQGRSAVKDYARLLLAAVQGTNVANLRNLLDSLDHAAHTPANLTWHHNSGHSRLVYKAPWPWTNNAGNTEVQAGAYLEFTHPWCPGSARWGEVHLHFNGRKITTGALRFAHLKDATLAVVGGNPTVTIPLTNPVVVAIVAHERDKEV
jgi:hypothetical protein